MSTYKVSFYIREGTVKAAVIDMVENAFPDAVGIKVERLEGT